MQNFIFEKTEIAIETTRAWSMDISVFAGRHMAAKDIADPGDSV